MMHCRTIVHVAGLAGLALALMAGCARTSVQDVQMTAPGLPRPQLILVHDFATSPSAVALDQAVGARLLRMANEQPLASDEEKVAQEIARIVTESLVKQINQLGIPAQPGTIGTPPVAGPVLAIEGQFLSVDEGNRLRRMVIGFGAGASEVRTLVQIYETTAEGRRLVEDFYSTVKSSRKPGMGPMAGVGAASGRAAESAAVATGVGALTARSQTVEGDAKHTADEIAKMLRKFFVEQHWINP
jgi:hypothetical protein